MKTTTKTAIVLAALGASAWMVIAQDQPPGRPDGPRRHRPPPPAVIGALDANHDRVIDANEIANASTALRALDKNGDGQLTPDEFVGKLPPPPPPWDGPAGDDGAPPRPPPPQE